MLLNWQYTDGAANRLYYALYHAGWAFLVKRGYAVPDHSGRRYFLHDEMGETLAEEGFSWRLGLQQDWEILWEQLRGLRVKADYYPDSVDIADLDDPLLHFVRNVVVSVTEHRPAP